MTDQFVRDITLPAGVQEDRRHRPRGPSDLFSFRRFGGPTALRRSVVLVGTVGIELFPNNPNRVMWWITNNSGVELTIDWTPEIVNGSGISVGGNGGFLTQTIEEDGNAVGDAVYAITTAGSNSVFLFDVSVQSLAKQGA